MSMSEKTKQQLESVRNRYFTPDFDAAYKYLLSIPEVHKRAILASQVNSVMKMYSSLKPNANTYESFVKELKGWNQEKNKHYNHRKEPSVSKKELTSFVETCETKRREWQESKDTNRELNHLQEYMLCLLFACVPSDLIKKVDLRTIQIKNTGNKCNYFTRNFIYFKWYKQGGTYGSHSVKKVDIPGALQKALHRLRIIKKTPYVFGDETELSQPAFSQMIKRVFGVTLTKVRKMVENEDTSKLMENYC